MAYQISDTYDSIDQAMRLMRSSMKGMPQRYRYLRHYDELRRSVAVLLVLLEEAGPWMDETREAEKSTTRAKQMLAAVR
ncbi:hypothetical protein [Pilimelia columellifera]|uniref:Uncharacterized protein n=1 Tax=Pilimelia columellifera subsp. columellifera TaxID=706583 RepID=A0ABN3MWR2_9ACTN